MGEAEMKFGAGIIRCGADGEVISYVYTKRAFTPMVIIHLNPPKKKLDKIARMKKIMRLKK